MKEYLFRAVTIEDALKDIHDTLGEEAVVLRTQTVKTDGLLSFLSKDLIEVSAGVPDQISSAEETESADHAGLVTLPPQGSDLQHDLNILSQTVRNLNASVRILTEQLQHERLTNLSPLLKSAYQGLLQSGTEESLAQKIVGDIVRNLKDSDLEDLELVKNELINVVSGKWKRRVIPRQKNNGPQIIALIGPTGVGKTSALAKLVISSTYWGGLSTAIVTVDTYRVAAIEQLKTIATLAGLPMKVAYNPSDVAQALVEFKDRDAIFIDTAGRSPLDSGWLAELQQFLKSAHPTEILLCLSISTRFEDQVVSVNRFKTLNPTGIIFTKLDEGSGVGTMLSVIDQSSLPLAFLSCGHNVPEDLFTGSPAELAKSIIDPDYHRQVRNTNFKEWREISDRLETKTDQNDS